MSRAAIVRNMMASGPLPDAWIVARTEQMAKRTREDCYGYRHANGTIVITQGQDADHPKLAPLHVARYDAPKKARVS